MRISKSLRGQKGSRRLDIGPLRELVRDRRLFVEIGVVRKPPGASSHFSVEGDDVHVEVETSPTRMDLTCRLGVSAGGVGNGLWRVPAVGEEVLVVIPGGEVSFMPVIVAVLSSGTVPSGVSAEKTILVATDAIEIRAPDVTVVATTAKIKAGTVYLGPDPSSVLPTDGFVHGQGVDTLTGLQYSALGSISTKVRGNK